MGHHLIELDRLADIFGIAVVRVVFDLEGRDIVVLNLFFEVEIADVVADSQFGGHCVCGLHVIREGKIDLTRGAQAVHVILGLKHLAYLHIYAAVIVCQQIIIGALRIQIADVLIAVLTVCIEQIHALLVQVLVVHHAEQQQIHDLLLHHGLDALILLMAERICKISELGGFERERIS